MLPRANHKGKKNCQKLEKEITHKKGRRKETQVITSRESDIKLTDMQVFGEEEQTIGGKGKKKRGQELRKLAWRHPSWYSTLEGKPATCGGATVRQEARNTTFPSIDTNGRQMSARKQDREKNVTSQHDLKTEETESKQTLYLRPGCPTSKEDKKVLKREEKLSRRIESKLLIRPSKME